ncbi:MAG: hypothetical protein PF569_06620 [Candidatus Woesearchaeota archaeon]|jgi:hypothetical protein|nr:hypothetical protein [Candidatus Woesearchaeota archaeon]
MESKNEKPVYKAKIGSMDIAVWEHKTEKGSTYCSVSYEKNYLHDKDGWQKTKNILIKDIPNLQIGLQKAYEFVKIRS